MISFIVMPGSMLVRCGVFFNMHIAVIMTCHNRKKHTIECLKSLYDQVHDAALSLDTYLVDDGSTDGTSEAVQRLFPDVRVNLGDGSLYWNGGMRSAFALAMKEGYDHYLWLNDDTVLYHSALQVMIQTYEQLLSQGYPRSIVVGSTSDLETGSLTYGGIIKTSCWHPFKYRIVNPVDRPQPCDTMNGNCVLIPQNVVTIVDNLDSAFTHTTGDFDYGLREVKKGCSIFVAPGFVGTCSINSISGTWKDQNLSFRERLKKRHQTKGVPFKEWKVFVKRHGGVFWPVFVVLPYIKMAAESIVSKWGKKR